VNIKGMIINSDNITKEKKNRKQKELIIKI
jgi:hypothetical protein